MIPVFTVTKLYESSEQWYKEERWRFQASADVC